MTAEKVKEKATIKQNYEKQISTLEHQLKDNNLRIKSLTEEKVEINFHTCISFIVTTILKTVIYKISALW